MKSNEPDRIIDPHRLRYFTESLTDTNGLNLDAAPRTGCSCTQV